MSQSISAPDTQVSHVTPLAPADPAGLASATWQRWKQIARAVGVVQTRLLMVIFYFLVVFPIGLVMRLRGDPLRLRLMAQSNWTPHRHEPPSVETARRQF